MAEAWRRLRALVVALGVVVGLGGGNAWAFPWMIAHKYTQCAQCHVDPSGGGALTDYGRGLGWQLLPMGGGEGKGEAPGREKDFAWGAVPLPKWLVLQGDVRGLGFPQPTVGADGEVADWQARLILMQADLRVAAELGPVVAYLSGGAVSEGAQGAWFTSNPDGANAVMRDAWVGWKPAKGMLLRAGRMNLPFGIRSEEHTQYVRSVTRTSTNADQQAGVAFALQKKGWRGELMGIAGNPQVAPDAFRERGYAGFVTYAPAKTLELGVSSLVGRAEADVALLVPRTRQAHGLLTRWSPAPRVAVLAEANLLHDVVGEGRTASTGGVGIAQVDWEAVQGLHLRGSGQWCDPAAGDDLGGVATGWAAAQWFITPRVDIRVDALHGTLACTPGAEARWYGLGQVHVLL